jgi:metallo-beta-lactamase family protein
MTIKLKFLGGTGSVTGSRYLIEADNTRVLIDCGMYQERQYRGRDWEPFPVNLKQIDAIFLSHAHLDHCGLLPKLVRDGYRNRVYCTPATRDIAEIILLDSAELLMEDAEYKKRRHRKEGKRGPYPERPLYTTDDVEASMPLFTAREYNQPIVIKKNIEVTFLEAGHTLGSAMLRLRMKDNREERTIIFSGDLGRQNKPILMDPTNIKTADYVVIESTYGDRVIESPTDMSEKLAEYINRTIEAGGNIVIPSFALERAQEVLYYLNQLLIKNAIPHLMVFLDSPMAIKITEVFLRYKELMDEETTALMRKGRSPFDFTGLNLVRTTEQSKAINRIKGTVIIIAGSGMCTGGRIKHHLVTNISRPDSTILFVGYQAMGTLGREIVDGAQEVRILGQYYPVRAQVVYLQGFSGHADREQLLAWLLGLKKPPKRVFVTHGEPSASKAFTDMAKEKTGWNVTAPEYGDEITLD